MTEVNTEELTEEEYHAKFLECFAKILAKLDQVLEKLNDEQV